MDDRRKSSRKYLSYFSRVVDRDTGRLLGYLVDMTTGGALMIGNISLKPGIVLPLRIDLPEDFASQEQLDMVAKVVWIQPDIDPELFRTGLQLVEIQPLDLITLERVLISHATKK